LASSATSPPTQEVTADAHPHRQRPLTRDVELRSTDAGVSVATVHVASDRRDRRADPVYVELILSRGQAEAPAGTRR
jgi:hypothetical protein